MANTRAIAAASAAIAGLLRDRYPRDDFGSSLEVSLYQAKSFESPMGDGFSVFLWRVGINANLRALPPRRTPDGRRYRASLPLDLYYMITAWADDTERQQRMLGWAMRALEDAGPLSAAQLNQYVAEDDTFRPEEAVDVVCDPLSLADQLTLWDRLKKLPPSVNYVVRMVLLDSDVTLDGGPPVQVRDFDMAVLR
ncbi:hypothetical protein PMI01_03241 [Caulobacter sp. AP07]|uniref:DUF4255 domain-containing protein n=1 Tax=Caulobacter sp. AP07 TaxID=1144304 RepID=UPI0002720C3B|nr:DUF4255 domain-containing protein [Caulobacter sp. AP07]EJL30124.1 hypothetical protein PMI01_03241 [Caulobacter sp. AP07]